MELKVYTDGASRKGGLRGPSAIAYMILDSDGRVLRKHSEYVGIMTSNQAEYEAMIAALKSAINFSDSATCYSDSTLLINQINGESDILKMRPLWRTVVGLKERFKKIAFVHMPRTDLGIQIVDRLANKVLEELAEPQPESPDEGKMKSQTDLSSFLSDRKQADT